MINSAEFGCKINTTHRLEFLRGAGHLATILSREKNNLKVSKVFSDCSVARRADGLT